MELCKKLCGWCRNVFGTYGTYVGERVLPPRPGCVLQSWSAPGRVESQQEPTDLPPWTFLPCTPPWASLRTDSSGGKVPSPASPSPGGQTGTSSKSPRQLFLYQQSHSFKKKKKYLMHLTITLIYKRWCNKITLGVFLWAEKGSLRYRLQTQGGGIGSSCGLTVVTTTGKSCGCVLRLSSVFFFFLQPFVG